MAYLDHAATSPMRDSVRRALAEAPAVANPSSTHMAGQQAAIMLEAAREQLAAALGAHPTEIVFTSGGTESVNLAIQGFAAARPGQIVAPDGEHHATLDTVEWLAQTGRDVAWTPIDGHAQIDADAFAQALTTAGQPAAVATALLVNNEIGTVQPIAELAESARLAGVPMHVDAVAAFGHVPIDVGALGIAALSVSAHKIGGPVGIGALVVARDATITPLIRGGGQQRGIRAGTQDALGAHCFAIAAAEAVDELAAESARLTGLTNRILEAAVAVEGVRATAPVERAPGIAHIAIEGADAEAVQFALDTRGFAVSNGSACTAGVPEPSHVMQAMGLGHLAPLRISLGHTTTEAEIDALIDALPAAIAQARQASSSR